MMKMINTANSPTDKSSLWGCILQFGLLSDEKYTQRAGAAVAGDGAAGIGFVSGCEVTVLTYSLHNGSVAFVVNGSFGDEENIALDILPFCQAVLNVHTQRLCKVAAVLLNNAHLTVFDFDAGLQVQQIGTQCLSG